MAKSKKDIIAELEELKVEFDKEATAKDLLKLLKKAQKEAEKAKGGEEPETPNLPQSKEKLDLSKLTAGELKAYAEEREINIEGLEQPAELIAAIEKAEEPKEPETPGKPQKLIGKYWDVLDKNGKLINIYEDKKVADSLAKKEKGRKVVPSPKDRTREDVAEAIKERKAGLLAKVEGGEPKVPAV